MNFVKSQIAKDLFRKVEAFGTRFAVRVNVQELDGDMVAYDECILPYEPDEEKIARLEQAAIERSEELSKAASRSGLVSEIAACKRELSSLDYKTIKRMQGELSDEEWEDVCNTCRQLRERINTAESNLAAMDEERNADSGVQA